MKMFRSILSKSLRSRMKQKNRNTGAHHQQQEREYEQHNKPTPNSRRRRVVRFAVDKHDRVPENNVYTYEAPSESEKALLYLTEQEMLQIGEACEAIVLQNLNNVDYLSNLGRVVLDQDVNGGGGNSSNNNNSQYEQIPDLMNSASSFESAASSSSSCSNTLGVTSILLPESKALEHMRGLEFLLEDEVGAQRQALVRNIVRFQQKLGRTAVITPEEKANLLSRTSMRNSREACFIARKFAEWDACEAARVHHQI